MKIVEYYYDVQTGEDTVIEREETKQEKTEREDLEAAFVARQAEIAKKAAARQAILDRLGLTEEEARLLLG